MTCSNSSEFVYSCEIGHIKDSCTEMRGITQVSVGGVDKPIITNYYTNSAWFENYESDLENTP